MNFIAFSNIQQEALKKIFELELNSLICPSIQIRDFPDNFKDLDNLKNQNSFNSFGDISFVFNQNNIFGNHTTIPKNDTTHQIYTGDAYTLRFPDISFSADIKPLNEFIRELNNLYKNNNVEEYIHDDYETTLKRSHKNKYLIKDDLKSSISVKFLFLKEANLLEEFKVFKIKQNKLSQYTKEDKELEYLLKETNTLTIRKNPKKYIDFINKKYKSFINEDDKEIWKACVFDNENNPSPKLFFKFFQKDINILRGTINNKIDKEKTNKLLAKLLKKSEKITNTSFDDFLEYKLTDIFHSPKIRDNKKPLTPENVVSYMKRLRGSGSEQGDFGGYRKASGKHQAIIRSYQDMIDHSDNLVLEEKMTEYDSRIDNKISHINSKLDAYDQNFIDIIEKLGKYPSLEKVKQHLNNTEFKTEDPLLLIEIQELAKLNNNRKHLYFEAKPNKAFYFNHHEGLKDEILTHVIVPNDIDKTLLKKLEKTNLKIIKYNSKTENSLARLKAFYQCRDNFINKPVTNKKSLKNKP